MDGTEEEVQRDIDVSFLFFMSLPSTSTRMAVAVSFLKVAHHLLQFLEPLRLIQTHPSVLLAPAVKGLFGYADLFDRLRETC
jgi:hypothetical protein